MEGDWLAAGIETPDNYRLPTDGLRFPLVFYPSHLQLFPAGPEDSTLKCGSLSKKPCVRVHIHNRIDSRAKIGANGHLFRGRATPDFGGFRRL